MAAQIQPLVAPIGTNTKVYTVSVPNSTPITDPTGGGKTAYQIEFDNTANTTAAYLKMYGVATPVHQTNAPIFTLRADASTKEYLILPAGTLFTTFSIIVTTVQDNTTIGPASTAAATNVAILYAT